LAKIPTDEQAPEFQLRPGTPPFAGNRWRGVNTESDPGSLEPNELIVGENIRLGRGKTIRTRSGMSLKLDLGTAAGTVEYFGALPVDNPRIRLWFTTLGVYGPPGTVLKTGSAVYHLDPTESPIVQQHSKFYSDTDSQPFLGKYGSKLYVGEKSVLKELVDITAPPGLSIGEVIPTAAAIPVASFPGFLIRGLQEFDGKLFISLEDTVTIGASKIAAFDGLTVTDDITAIRPAQAFGIWRNKLVAGFDATAANIRVRDSGAAPGSWTTFALAGFLCAQLGNAMVEERQYLYIASGTDKLFRFDGIALTLAQTIVGCAVDGLGLTALTLHNGLLYYGWNTPSTAYAARIGRHDPDSTFSAATEWIDTYKDVTTDQPNFVRLSALASYRGQIYAGGRKSWVVATAINDVKGTLESINDTGFPDENFRVLHFQRFP